MKFGGNSRKKFAKCKKSDEEFAKKFGKIAKIFGEKIAEKDKK